MKNRANLARCLTILTLSYVMGGCANAQPAGTVLNCSTIDAPFSPSPATRTTCDAVTPGTFSCTAGEYSLSTTYTVKCTQTSPSGQSPYYSNDNPVTFDGQGGCLRCGNEGVGSEQDLACEPSIQSQYTMPVAASGSNTWQVYSVSGVVLTNGLGGFHNYWCGSGDTQLYGSDSCDTATCNCPNHNQCIYPAGSYAADTCYYEGGCDSSETLTGDCCVPQGTPIIVDLSGEGFNLTNAADGVRFDLLANGAPVRTAWTAQGAQNAWLALDRNGNGRIDSGAELFGNHTTQPPSKTPNGFLALKVFDLPANGGNGDGVIDAGDVVFSKLRLWIDENHNGISEPSELHTLEEFGIYAINLADRESKFTDIYGNQFRYRGTIRARGQADRVIYDVILRYEP